VHPVNLLIVEDHPTSRKLLRVQLQAEGHSVVEAADGREALRVLSQSDIDGVISDILMPEMDGFRLCYEMRKSTALGPRIPVVLYTGTFFTAADLQLAQSLGVDGFIRKPAIAANSGRMESFVKDAGDGEQRDCWAQVAAATRRMNELLDTLADFIRLGATPVSRITIDLDSLVDEALLIIQTENPNRSIQWERHTLSRAQGDPALLRLVFITLLRNAIRSTRGREIATIAIGSRRGRADEVVVFVRDNGMGVERHTTGLPPASLVPSEHGDPPTENQLRLANVHRIVSRHGGRVWSEAAVGHGTTYFFSLSREHGQDSHHR